MPAESESTKTTNLHVTTENGVDPAAQEDRELRVTSFLRAHGMIWQAQCYPQSVDALKPVLELVAELGADHV